MKKIFIIKLAAVIILITFITLMGFKGIKMYEKKATWTFADSQGYFTQAREKFTDDEYVWDLTGGSFFYKDPYYACCLPYGEYEEAIRFRLPELEESLRKYSVKHIFIQYPGRFWTISPKNIEVLRKFYILDLNSPILSAGKIWEKLGIGEKGEFEVIADGNYGIFIGGKLLKTDELKEKIRLDGKIILSNPIFLGKGKYTLTTISDEENVRVEYISRP